MADKPTLYAQFDGDEIDGKLYGLGDPIDDQVTVGTIAYLEAIGRIGATKPATAILVPSSDTPLVDMKRSELEATFRSEVTLGHVSDEDLISAIQKGRDALADEPEDDVYADIKDSDLTKLKTAQLQVIADNEGVTFVDNVKTNADRVAAIQAKRSPPAQ